METKTPFTESELLDFFNGHLSEAEEKEILAWKDASKENRHSRTGRKTSFPENSLDTVLECGGSHCPPRWQQPAVLA